MTRQKRWLLRHPHYQREYERKNRARRARQRRLWEAKHPNSVKERSARYYAKKRAFIDGLKSKPCMDCRRKYPPYVMQFDHRDPKQKRFQVAMMVTRPIPVILAEIAKCDLVCANCHFIRTFGGRR